MKPENKTKTDEPQSLSTAGLGVTEDDLDNLRHMLGAQPPTAKRDYGYRNYFAAGEGQIDEMERLVSAGLARRGLLRHMLSYYHATKAGCAAIGLSRAATKRTFEP